MKDRLEDIFKDSPPEECGLLHSLGQIEGKFSYIPEEAITYLSERTGIPAQQIRSVIIHNDRFHERPEPEYTIRVCSGQVCRSQNATWLWELCLQELGLTEKERIPADQETYLSQDGRIRAELTGCVGACGRAPVVTVNEEIFGDMDESRLKELLRKIVEQHR